MAALPSFVELMASLGLSKDGDAQGTSHERRDSSDSRTSSESRSSSVLSSPESSPPLLHIPARTTTTYKREKSPSIVISECDEDRAREPDFKRRASSGNIKTSRYNPYQPASRRGSTSTLSDSSREYEFPKSTHPPTSSRRGSAHASKALSSRVAARRGSEHHLSDIKSSACAPISSFARRRSPQASPTTPSFVQRQRTRVSQSEFPPPVSLPTLPPMLAQTFATYSFPTASSDDRLSDRSRSPSVGPLSPMEVEQPTFVKQQQAGLRISSLCRTGSNYNYVESRQVSPLA